MLSIGALPSECAAPNSQGRGPKHPGLVTPVAVSKGGSLRSTLSPSGGCPCFASGRPCHVRGPLPCWDAVAHGGSLLLAPAGKCGCLACSASRIIPLAEL